MSATVENNRKEMELMRRQLEAKDEVNMMLANEISNLRLQVLTAIPLLVTYLHRTAGLQGKRKLLPFRKDQAEGE